jgi:hypothetical protein
MTRALVILFLVLPFLAGPADARGFGGVFVPPDVVVAALVLWPGHPWLAPPIFASPR